jgi:hypothetical protein
MAVALIGIASSALAQDANPEAGEGGEVTATAPDASGDGSAAPETGPAKPISAALLLGYGISLESGGNLWGLGFGLRGGYNLDKIYLGARFVYYLGESQSTPLGDVSVNVWELGIEGGYDVPAGPATIRPELGLGLAFASFSAPGGGSTSDGNFFIAPGAAALFDVSDNMFVGADARFQIVFGNSTAKALVLLATFGLRF